MEESKRKKRAMESVTRLTESSFDESYFKMAKFLKNKPNREKLQKFMTDNPGLVILVSKDKIEESQKKFTEYMKNRPDQQRISDRAESQQTSRRKTRRKS